jgi:hypothetical protein
LYAFLIYNTRATCPAHTICPDSVTITFSGVQILVIFVTYHYPPAALGPHIHLGTLFSYTFDLCSSSNSFIELNSLHRRLCPSNTEFCGPQPNITISRGIFVTERAGMPFRKLFLRRMQAGTAFCNFFPCHRYNEVRRVLLSYRSSYKLA